ncbi:hypothetical protein B0H11DRAFT_12832 [Mycena galericulata]|nr:hypothetical protein B0H11DRAFT_12832 [Mycena galericulata]
MLYYTAREEYGPLVNSEPTAPLDAQFWRRVKEAFEKNDTAFQCLARAASVIFSRSCRTTWRASLYVPLRP